MPFDPQRVRAICFDVDGTLSDTDDLWTANLERVIKPLRFALPGRDARSFARRLIMAFETPGTIIYGIPDRLQMDAPLARASNWLARHARTPRHTFWLVPGVRETLQRLQPHYPMAVVSARDERSTLAFLDQHSLRPFFTVVVTALSASHTKPYPDPIFYAAGRMGVAPEECLMIGDTTVDIRAGRSAGAQTIGVLCGFGEAPELTRCGADLLLNSTADLPQALGR